MKNESDTNVLYKYKCQIKRNANDNMNVQNLLEKKYIKKNLKKKTILNQI